MTKTGFIAIVGKPNVGKSTLLNALLGEKVAIVSKKPQTTRTRITGILTKEDTQYVFLDTPGMHTPKTKLGDFMVKTIQATIGEVDAVLLMVEPGYSPSVVELGIIERLKKQEMPAILVINKIDTVHREMIAETITVYAKLYDFTAVVPISAMKNDGVDTVLEEVNQFMQESPWFFPSDIVTDQPERQFVAEVIREKILRTLDEEIPHGTAVVIEAFEEKAKIIRIRAEIFCEKTSHKGILIGKDGQALKQIGTYAREDLEKFFGMQVYLNLWVKVKENWRDNSSTLSNFGFKME